MVNIQAVINIKKDKALITTGIIKRQELLNYIRIYQQPTSKNVDHRYFFIVLCVGPVLEIPKIQINYLKNFLK